MSLATARWSWFDTHEVCYINKHNTLPPLRSNRLFCHTDSGWSPMTSRNQGLSSNDQRRQRRETLGTRLRIYILIIKVNKLFSLLLSWCLLKEIENMFSVFLSSCRYTHESLALLPACSHSISGSLWPKQRCNTCFAMCYGKVLPHLHVTFVWISLDRSNLAPKSNRIERSRLWANLSSGKGLLREVVKTILQARDPPLQIKVTASAYIPLPWIRHPLCLP